MKLRPINYLGSGICQYLIESILDRNFQTDMKNEWIIIIHKYEGCDYNKDIVPHGHNLPAPDIIAREITEYLETAWEQLNSLAEDLGKLY